MIDLIAPHSRDVHGLAAAPRIARLREVLQAEPALANARNPHGLTPLFVLPDDEDAAAHVADLLIAHGADPRAADAAGETPARAAARRGLDDAAELIAEAAESGARPWRG
jgi:ankyrin repeat protein